MTKTLARPTFARKATAAALAATVIGLAMLPSAPAEARYRHRGLLIGLAIAAPLIAGTVYSTRYYGYGECGALKRRAFVTGSAYWQARYEACMGY